jgi:segregation and condensation protein A
VSGSEEHGAEVTQRELGPASPAEPTAPIDPIDPSAPIAAPIAAASAAASAAPGFAAVPGEVEEGGLPATWRVQLPVFEGPLDLLLHLIKINQVEITDIPVALICDQFHAYLQLMEELNLDIAGEYIYEAAFLIHLKSKMLLPRPAVMPGREEEEDPRQELVERLLEYRRLKEAAQSLAEVDRMRIGIWTRRRQPLPQPEPDAEGAPDSGAPLVGDTAVDLGDVSLFDLLGALKQTLLRYEREHPPPLLVSAEAYSVRGQFDRLLAALDAGRPFDLLDDLRRRSCRAEAIAAFLAVLELARLNLIRVHQTASGEILVYRTTRDLAEAELEAIGG